LGLCRGRSTADASDPAGAEEGAYKRPQSTQLHHEQPGGKGKLPGVCGDARPGSSLSALYEAGQDQQEEKRQQLQQRGAYRVHNSFAAQELHRE